MFRKLLVAIDQSNASLPVVEHAIALSQAIGAEILFLHVLSPLDEGYPSPIFPGPDGVLPTIHAETIKIYDQQWETFERAGLAYLRSLTEQATASGVGAEFTQAIGDPGRVICKMAATWNADVILLGRRGRSGLAELLLGSVSNYVLHHAPCSVLTIQGTTLQTEAVVDRQLSETR